jgi:hypothetical protein
MKSLLTAILCLTLVASSTAQSPTPPKLSKNAAKIKQQVTVLAKGAPIRVDRRGADEEYGTFVSSDESELVIFDVNTKIEVHLKFEDVRKVKDGYGSAKSSPHRRVPYPVRLLIGAVIVCGLIVALASLDN